ncbi:HCNGP-like domain containing protein [Naviculisporaceae sp. PSN 640]
MGLVQYDSDDDSDEQMQVDTQPQPVAQKPVNAAAKPPSDNVPTPSPATVAPESSTPKPQHEKPQNEGPKSEPVPGPQLPPSQGPVLGPALGPQPPPPTQQFPEVDMSFLETSSPSQNDPSEPPKSPYTAQRTLLRDLTLPAIDISTLDIPPSPPSSPSQTTHLDALNKKFDDFLRLKRTKGIHFNERLATSSMLSNPSLTDKMLGFVGIESEFLGPDDVKATEQYMTTLSNDLWDPAAFPGWAYKGMLRKSQERVAKERERGKGEAVQFVAAGVVGGGEVVGGLSATTGSGSAPRSRSGTPGLGGASTAGAKRKSRFDA